MKIPLSWLKEYIDIPFSPERIAETLTLAGLEVDAVESTDISFEGVFTAKILETTPHPNADRLRIAKVFDGSEEFQVVCGAPNCRPGLVTAFAKVGAKLKDDQGKTWTIKKSKIRDMESCGMLCSGDELKLDVPGDGILELSQELPLNMDLGPFYQETVFTLSLTPNLGHCMSIYGIARELSALFNIPLKKTSSSLQENPSAPSIRDLVKVHVEDKENCLRYDCRLVQGVRVGPSPSLIARRLELSGIRSVNNVVDISNYVLLEFGQPLHFFDYDRLAGASLSIESCKEKTALTTLDGIERTLPEGSLVIKDEKKVVAIAGIIGAENSAVSESTVNVLIEAAVFSPGSVRKTARFLGVHTDASHRFERGVDFSAVPLVLDLAADLLSRTAGGIAAKGHLDKATSPSPHTILCRTERVNALLGISLSIREMIDLLKRLDVRIVKEEGDRFEALIPSYRNDLKQEIDLVEEISRLYGFQNIPKRLCVHKTSPLLDDPIFTAENTVRSLLIGEGLQEFMTCDLIGPSLADLVKEPEKEDQNSLISVLYSKSNDYSLLRPSLLPGLLQVVKHNFDRHNFQTAGFEVGRIHFKQNDLYKEQTSVGILLSGPSAPYHYDPKPGPFDFFDLKGMTESLLEAHRIENVSFEPATLTTFQPGRQALIKQEEKVLGILGEIHPDLLSRLDLPQRVYFAELNLLELLSLHSKRMQVRDVPLYPGSERDWTLSLRKETPVRKIIDAIREEKPPLLEKVFLLDLFESDRIGKDRKNVTWRLLYKDTTKTLDFETIEKEHAKLIETVAKKLHDYIL